MQRRPAIHTSLRASRWVNTRDGSRDVVGGTYDSHVEAVAAGRLLALADRVEHVCFRPDGSIDEITRSG